MSALTMANHVSIPEHAAAWVFLQHQLGPVRGRVLEKV
jgi:hypothetical protein